MHRLLAQPVAEAIDQRRDVVAHRAARPRSPAGARAAAPSRAPTGAWLRSRPRAELVELFLEQAEQVPGIEAGARGADREALRLAIQAIAGEVELARPAFMRPQRFRQSLQQQIERAVDVGALHDQFGEIHPHVALRRRQ
jgi:hypothetical protein